MTYQDQIHQEYIFLKKLHRQFRGFVRTLAIIHATVKEMKAMLEESNKKAAIFWAEFRRDFPEVELDEIAWRNVVYGYNSATVTPDTSAGDDRRFEVVEAKVTS